MQLISANPIGKPQSVPVIDQYVQTKIAEWKQLRQSPRTIWWKIDKNLLTQTASKFFLDAVDYLVDQVNSSGLQGQDKKATVLAAIALIYEVIAPDIMPIWLWPFSSAIENLIIYVILSIAIDWVVEKYNANNLWGTSDQAKKQNV